MNTILLFTTILAAASGSGGGKGPGMDMTILMLVPIFLLFFLMWRSQKKKDSERKQMLGNLKKGDPVVTIGGLHGEIIRINDHEVVLLVDKSKNVEMKFQRTAVHAMRAGKTDGDKNSGGMQEGGSQI